MSPVETAYFLREAQRHDLELARAIDSAVRRAGCDDMLDWVEQEPKIAAALAESVKDVDGQIAHFAERLANKDLS